MILVLEIARDLYGLDMPLPLAVTSAIALFLASAFRSLIVFAGGLMCEDLKSSHHHEFTVFYQKVLCKIPDIASLAFMGLCLTLAFEIVVFILGAVLLVLPFLLLTLLARVSPGILQIISLQGGNISLGLAMLVVIVAIVANVWFALGLWGASYTLLLEGRKGLDALASSFLYVKGKRLQIFWRVLLLTLIGVVPLLILVLPVYAFIAIAMAKLAALSVLLLGTLKIPPVPQDLALWRDSLSFVARLVSLPLLTVFNYYLWRDVKETSHAFNETAYTKVRKWIKIGVWSGAVILAIGVFLSLGTFVLGPSDPDDSGSFGNIPSSGMMLLN